ncbi:MAG: hypothetical protein KAH54_09730 [Candidatus Sabulitectum sp.]|nr:hypothetical protein [Candidatus Sabulitectum sp.]
MLNSFLFLTLVLLSTVFSVKNFRSGYSRAGRIALLAAAISVVVFSLLYKWEAFHFFLPAICLLLFLISFIPLPKVSEDLKKEETEFDERDIVFSRYRLKPGTENYLSYYGKKPEKEVPDAATRALPGLLSKQSRFYHRFNAAAADASFFLLHHLRDSVDGEVREKTGGHTPEQIGNYLRSLLEHYGVSCYGTALMKPDNYYSHTGRGQGTYGDEISTDHKFAIVLGSEMKPRFTATAPLSPEVVETGSRYVDSAVWAVQTASFIRDLGYSARAHIDGNYQVITPLVAHDAGLGGFGWSSLFLTEEFGPRVRFSVVTTDLDVSALPVKQQTSFLSFCNICRKCAINCPSRAINPDKLEKVNTDRCFKYWNSVGTDCGKCMAVCPMGHPWGVLKSFALRSYIAGWLLKKLDDIFYGRKPGSLRIPQWMGNK